MPRHLRIFLASPGDVADERSIARRELERLPYAPGLRGKITVEIVAWDTPGADTPMLATMTPQAAIARGLPKPSECDIVIVVFWSRMGTPLPEQYRKLDGAAYLSGTEWEYLDAIRANHLTGKPEVLVYRRTERCLLDPDEPQFESKLAQRRHVESFFATFRNADGSIARGVNTYSTPDEFREKVYLHLCDVVERLSTAYDSGAGKVPVEQDFKRWEGTPFPGLRSLTPEDSPVFFGRDREVDDLVRRLAEPTISFIVVVGASGSGKSSLVAAGLLPRLRENCVEGSKDWLLPGIQAAGAGTHKVWSGLRFTPAELGNSPFQALAAKLAPLIPGEEWVPRSLAEELAQHPDRLSELLAKVLDSRPQWAKALIFVDQFEELLVAVDSACRAPFVNMLIGACLSSSAVVIATLRADFYQRLLEDQPRIAEFIQQSGATYPLSAPGANALLKMIVGPAERAGLEFEEGLPDRILAETGNAPGGLALLAFALNELYAARTPEGKLTCAAYQAFGGTRGAIHKRAESTFVRLPTQVKAALGDVFRELVDVDARGVSTRRRVSRIQVDFSLEARRLVSAFVDARLLVTDCGDEIQSVVEIAHEALLSEWQTLAEWIVARTDDLRLRRQAETAAAEWQHAQCDQSHLWPHERLVLVHAALARLQTSAGNLAEPGRSFLRPEAERLLEEIARQDTTHYRRAEIGDRLDKIGDQRPGVGLRVDGLPDIQWCDVPGGKVRLSGVSRSFAVAPFKIAKYPVTYRQYQAFLAHDEGYANHKWWKGLRRERSEQYRTVGNCPAENVSWSNAVAYCRWLSAMLGTAVRLPTECEWQCAATGGEAGRNYPWGTGWIEDAANTTESRLNRTTAVGMYPYGATVGGALDMVGNVWEWCLNKYETPSDVSLEGAGRRVLRGGSWHSHGILGRCTFRDYPPPDYRYGNFGFRLVQS